MRATIIRIGKSSGIRLPAHVRELFGKTKEVELECLPEGLLIKTVRTPRSGWQKSFAKVKKEIAAEKLDHIWLNAESEHRKRSGSFSRA